MADVPKVFKLFGGTRKLARALKLAPSTVQRWKDSGVIPARRQQAVLNAARAADLGIIEADLLGETKRAAA